MTKLIDRIDESQVKKRRKQNRLIRQPNRTHTHTNARMNDRISKE